MKNETIPYPREFGPGAIGPDCRAVKRALAVALGGPHGMSTKTNTFSKPAQECLSDFKQQHKLLHDPIYTVQAHGALQPFFDEYGASLMVKQARTIEALRQRTVFVATLKEMIVRHDPRHYAQVRPIPVTSKPVDRSDCSGSVTVAAYRAGLPDPNGFAYHSPVEGNTGTILAHCAHVDINKLLPGDLIVYRRGSWDTYGHHVVAVLDIIASSGLPGLDYDCFSHGKEGDPRSIAHSVELEAQASRGYGTATGCRFLPTP